MLETITKLDNWLKENRNEFYKKLNNGLTTNEIKGWEKKFGFELPNNFKMLYQWKNGQKPENRECFYNHLYFDPIEVVYEHWEIGNEDLTEFNEEGTIVWGESWLRFMSAIDSNGYCLDVNGDFKEAGNIIYYIHDDENEALFSDLETMMKMVLNQFEEGVYGYAEVDGIVSFVLINSIKEKEISHYYTI